MRKLVIARFFILAMALALIAGPVPMIAATASALSAAFWSPPVNISNTLTFSAQPMIAVDSRGALHVVWDEGPYDNYDIFYSTKPTGGSWSAPVNISNSGGADWSAIVVDSNDNIHVVWHVDINRDGQYDEIFYATKPSDGPWPAPLNISNNAGNSRFPDVAADKNGALHVVWMDNTPGNEDIFYTIRPVAGTWATPLNISNNSGISTRPAITSDDSGAPHIVWEDYTPGNSEILYTTRPSGGIWSAPLNISNNSGTSMSPALTIDDGAALYVVWDDGTTSNYSDIFYASRPAGGIWSTPLNLSNTSGMSARSVIAVDSVGALHVVWEDYAPGNPEILYTTRATGGTWSVPLNISNTPESSRHAAIAVDSTGAIHVLWDDQTSNWDIFYVAAPGSVPDDTTVPFLQFPLGGKTPWNAAINAVFDHSMSSSYAADDVVVAYSGERGEREYGADYVTTFGGLDLYGFMNSSSSYFTVNGNYTGDDFLYYDGHPGYDYRTIDQGSNVPVLAAASGTAYRGSDDYGIVYIDHLNGYRTYYMHLLNESRIVNGTLVTTGEQIGIAGSTGASAVHLHFEVRRNVGGQWVPVDPYGWQAIGVDPYLTIGGVENVNLWLDTAEVGRVILIEPLSITPAGPYFIGDALTATFTVENIGNAAIILDKLLLGGRYNGGELPGGGYPDFTYQTVTLLPGQSDQYQGVFTIPEPGEYNFFIAYYIENPTEAERAFLDDNNWNTSIELGEGLTDADRTRQLKAETLLAKYAPVLYLHPEERFFPTDISAMLDESDLKERRLLWDMVRDEKPVAISSLDVYDGEQYYLDLTQARPGRWYTTANGFPGYIFGSIAELERWNSYPAAIYGRQVETDNKIVLQYWFFYVYNDWFNDHEGDWEMVQVILNKDSREPERITYSQHYAGQTLTWDEVTKVEGVHPKVFVAEGSHSNWPTDGDHDIISLRDASVLNDRTSSNGKALYPSGVSLSSLEGTASQEQYVLTDISGEPIWAAWLGKWGEIAGSGLTGPDSPVNNYIESGKTKVYKWRQPIAYADTVGSGEFRILALSPVNVHAYDAEGNHTGATINGEVEMNVPGSYLYIPSVDGPEVMWLYTMADLRFVVEGTDEGTYELMIMSLEEGRAATFSGAGIPTAPGAIHQYTIDWDVLSRGGEGVTIQVDSDGDGIFDHALIVGNVLTGDEFVLQTETVIDFDPDVLNLKARERFVTVYIELPLGYDVGQIDVTSIRLNDTLPALAKPTEVGDYDADGVPDLMVKFDGAAVRGVLATGEQVDITITGKVSGIGFRGSDTIRVVDTS